MLENIMSASIFFTITTNGIQLVAIIFKIDHVSLNSVSTPVLLTCAWTQNRKKKFNASFNFFLELRWSVVQFRVQREPADIATIPRLYIVLFHRLDYGERFIDNRHNLWAGLVWDAAQRTICDSGYNSSGSETGGVDWFRIVRLFAENLCKGDFPVIFFFTKSLEAFPKKLFRNFIGKLSRNLSEKLSRNHIKKIVPKILEEISPEKF